MAMLSPYADQTGGGCLGAVKYICTMPSWGQVFIRNRPLWIAVLLVSSSAALIFSRS